MKKKNKFRLFLSIFSFLATTNYYFSNLITHKLLQGWNFESSLVNIIYMENTGAAFSLMQNSTKFLIFLSIMALIAMFYYIIKHLETLEIKEVLFLSFLTSGILGNLYERIYLGYVRDFFDLAFSNFPVFNISDIYINIGVLGIIILILLSKKPIKIL